MATFKRVQVHKLTSDFGDAIKIADVKLTPPNAGEVRVKNHFAGVNATDINITAGRYFTDGKLPFDIGFEGCGLVDEVGEGVDKFKKGQPVIYLGNQGYSEYIYAQPEQLIPVPELKPEFLATMVTGLTATIGLDVAGQIKKGEKVLITAAAGGTGQTCVQWAKSRGCHVIGTTSTDEKVAFLKSIGCDHVINYKKEDLYETLSKSYPDGVDVIWETIGGEMFVKLLYNHLAIHGRMVIVGGITGYKTEGIPSMNTEKLPGHLLMRSQTLTGFLLMNERDKFAEYFAKIIPAVHTGELKIKVDNGEKSPEGRFKGIEASVRGVNHLHAAKNEGKVYIDLS